MHSKLVSSAIFLSRAMQTTRGKQKSLASTIKIKRMPIDKKWLRNGFVVLQRMEIHERELRNSSETAYEVTSSPEICNKLSN
jgi:hypothetical protein